VRVLVTEFFRALGGGEIRLAVDKQNVDCAELGAVELSELILIFHGGNLLSI
jgi:hypothetical protein